MMNCQLCCIRYSNGHKSVEANFIDNIKEGLCIEWYPSSIRKSECKYANGMVDIENSLFWNKKW